MGDSARNCKRSDEIAVVDLESLSVSSFSKKMKVQIDHEFNSPSHHELLQDHRLSPALSPDKTISHVSPSNSGGIIPGDTICPVDSIACRSSGIDSNLIPKDSLRSTDLEAKSLETETPTCIHNKFRETNPSMGDTDQMDSQKTEGDKNCREKLQAKKIPSKEEIDQFFAEEEKKEQKRFADKYNYDVAKDVPLEGRYQWVPLKP